MPDLKSALTERTAWFDWEHGISVHLRYIDRKELSNWLNESKRSKWNPQTHQREETTDNSKWLKFLATAIVDWKNLTAANAHLIGPFKKGPKKEVYEASQSNKELILERAYGLENFIFDKIRDIQQFEEERVEEEKKGSGSGQPTA